MIESIKLANVATYGAMPEVMEGLSQFNYIYGPNGSGKTTISRVIANTESYPDCSVRWKGNLPLQEMVYNYDFVERNFTQAKELKGVFTLGEAQIETREKIAAIKKELDGLSGKNSDLRKTLEGAEGKSGKKAELTELESDFRNRVWELKKKYDSSFSLAFEGLRNSSEKFRERFIKEHSSNKADLLSLDELKDKAQSIFKENPVSEVLIPVPSGKALFDIVSSRLFSKPIIGKTDVDIAAMIKRLGNSDWVKTGRKYFENSDGICPFCQQPTSISFSQSLAEYFDETYMREMDELESLTSSFEIEYANLADVLNTIRANPSRFLDVERFSVVVDLFLSKCLANRQKLQEKRVEPSRIITFEPMQEFLDTVIEQIVVANMKIDEHNYLVDNFASEKKLLTSQVWRYLLEEGKNDLSRYVSSTKALEKAISGITARISQNDIEIQILEQQVRTLEKKITSIQPTIDGINALLKQFGFTSFLLRKAPNGNSYQLIRSNGSEAKSTLSEGEKSFVCFLYFYYLLKGSESESGTATDRIVVFDDPVSSLDCEVLFIVSSLIKGLFDEVREAHSQIKQVFILTHNVYFHKEITFNVKRNKDKTLNEETFWTVQKTDQGTKIKKWKENTIRTSYELLWAEVRCEHKSSLTIQNTLRRILENYFKILGGISPDDICNKFTGRDRVICKSLFSWVNDGSHFIQDDLFVAIDDGQIDSYLEVFRKIFEVSGHPAHYEMMMGSAKENVAEQTQAASF